MSWLGETRQSPSLGLLLPQLWALIAQSLGNGLNTPLKMFTLGENILKQRVVIAVLEDGKIGLVVGIVCPNDDALARNRDTLMILFWGYLIKYHSENVLNIRM